MQLRVRFRNMFLTSVNFNTWSIIKDSAFLDSKSGIEQPLASVIGFVLEGWVFNLWLWLNLEHSYLVWFAKHKYILFLDYESINSIRYKTKKNTFWENFKLFITLN